VVNGSESVRFESARPRQKVFEDIEDALAAVGDARVSKKGAVDIDPRPGLAGGLTAVTMDADVRERDGKYTVTVDYAVTLSTMGWVIFALGVLFFLLGLLVLLAPAQAKGTVSTAVRRALRDLDE